MLSFLGGGSGERDQWKDDFIRVSRSLRGLQSKISQTSRRGASYRELRLLLREVALLEEGLQKLILQDKLSHSELQNRANDLRKMNNELLEPKPKRTQSFGFGPSYGISIRSSSVMVHQRIMGTLRRHWPPLPRGTSEVVVYGL